MLGAERDSEDKWRFWNPGSGLFKVGPLYIPFTSQLTKDIAREKPPHQSSHDRRLIFVAKNNGLSWTFSAILSILFLNGGICEKTTKCRIERGPVQNAALLPFSCF
jgi:hypothetical protein